MDPRLVGYCHGESEGPSAYSQLHQKVHQAGEPAPGGELEDDNCQDTGNHDALHEECDAGNEGVCAPAKTCFIQLHISVFPPTCYAGAEMGLVFRRRCACAPFKAMNKAMKPAKLQELMKEFAQLDEQLEWKSEMMGDAIDDAVAEEGDEEEQVWNDRNKWCPEAGLKQRCVF